MAFQLPSAASRRIVSILNTSDSEERPSLPSLLPPPSSASASSASTTAVPSPTNGSLSSGTESNGSLGNSLFSNTSFGSSATDATSIQPCSRSQPSSWLSSKASTAPSSWSSKNSTAPSSWSSTKTSVDNGYSNFFEDKARMHSRVTASPGPMSEAGRPAGLDGGYMASDTRPVADASQVQQLRAANGTESVASVSSQPSTHQHDHQASSTSSSGSTSSAHKRAKPSIVHGKKRYPCSHPGCDKTFSTSGHAARHNRIHTGQKPYKCTFPGCKASFSRQDNALAHFRTGHALAKPREAEEGEPSYDGSSEYDGSIDVGADIGRRALEQGTAIAIVRDGKVERTVGLPKGRRSASTSKASTVDLGDDAGYESTPRSGSTPAAEYAQNRNNSLNRASAPRNKHLDQSIFSQTKPSSVHSDIGNRTPAGLPALSARAHPYKYALSHHRASIGSLAEARYTHSDSGAEAADEQYSQDRQNRGSHDVRNSVHLSPRRGSAGFLQSSTRPHLLAATLSQGPRPTAPLSQSGSFSRPSWMSRPDPSHVGFSRSRQASTSTPHEPSLHKGLAGPRHAADASSVRSGSPEAILSLSTLRRSALPCSSDRSTTADTGPNSRYYHPASPLDAGEGPIRLPPLSFPNPM